MLNLYQELKNLAPFSRQLTCKGMLFTNYDCPQVVRKVQCYIEQSVVVFVVSGRRIYHWKNRSWELKDNSCAFVKKGGMIAERPHGEDWCAMAFFIPDDFLIQLVESHKDLLSASLNNANEPMIPLSVNEISYSCFISMLPYFRQSPPPAESLIELKFRELMLSLLLNPANTAFVAYINSLRNAFNLSLEQVMQNNFSFRLSIADFAKLCCKSVSTFKRDFKKQYNETPARWLMNRRIEMARDLLETSDLSVAEISMECGFENSNHFSRVFRDKTGIPPLQFRQRRRQLI